MKKQTVVEMMMVVAAMVAAMLSTGCQALAGGAIGTGAAYAMDRPIKKAIRAQGEQIAGLNGQAAALDQRVTTLEDKDAAAKKKLADDAKAAAVAKAKADADNLLTQKIGEAVAQATAPLMAALTDLEKIANEAKVQQAPPVTQPPPPPPQEQPQTTNQPQPTTQTVAKTTMACEEAIEIDIITVHEEGGN